MPNEKNIGVVPATQEKLSVKDTGDARVISALQLGNVEEVHTLNHSFYGWLILFSVVALIFAVLFALHGFLLALFPLLGIPAITYPFLYRFSHMRIYVCDHGLLYLQHKKKQLIRWDELSKIYIGSYRYPYVRFTLQNEREGTIPQPDNGPQLFKALRAKGNQYGFQVITN